MGKVWVLGGTAFDLLAADVPTLPVVDSAGDEFTDLSLVHLPEAPVQSVGGNAGNAAFVLCRLGADVDLCTAIGDDPLGRTLTWWLRQAGCTLDLVPPRRTAINFVATDTDSARRSFFFPVPLDATTVARTAQAKCFSPGDHVALRGYPHPDAEVLSAWVHRAQALGATVSLDIGPATAGLRLPVLDSLLDDLDILFCNRRELAGLDPTQEPERIASSVADRLGVGLVVKKGAAGAEFRSRGRQVSMPAVHVDHGATVGAGDAFDAGFIFAAFVEDRGITDALRFASTLVALTLERARGVSGAPTADEVVACLDDSRHESNDGVTSNGSDGSQEGPAHRTATQGRK